jgi:hypothetical protein
MVFARQGIDGEGQRSRVELGERFAAEVFFDIASREDRDAQAEVHHFFLAGGVVAREADRGFGVILLETVERRIAARTFVFDLARADERRQRLAILRAVGPDDERERHITEALDGELTPALRG